MEENISPQPVTLKNILWTYRGEGEQNLVIALMEERSVLRLTKQFVNCIEGDESLKRNRQLLKFSENVIKPLLGKPFVPAAELISICREDVANLSKKLKAVRPAYRKHKDLSVDGCFGLKLQDCAFLPKSMSEIRAFGPSIAIEIKPKAGFLCKFEHLPPHLSLKRLVCKYQLNQLKKLREGKIKRTNSYCPVELFSGCRKRMHCSLHSLLDNPQNNLRIFKEGLLIFGEDSNLLASQILSELFTEMDDGIRRVHSVSNNLVHLVTEALLKEFGDCDRLKPNMDVDPPQTCACQSVKASDSDGSTHVCSGCDGLPENCVLGRILAMQKLDRIDVEGIFKAYQSFQKFSSEFPSEVIDEWLYGQVELSNAWLTLSPSQQEIVMMIREFLLSATAKDCSVMIALQRLEKSAIISNLSSVIDDADGFSYLMNVSVLDVDVKPHVRILKYLNEGRELIANYQKIN